MWKKLRKWRDRRRCKRCKLRAICLSMSKGDMGAKIYYHSTYIEKAPRGCSALENYDPYEEQDVTYTGTAGSLRKRSAAEVMYDFSRKIGAE